MTRIFSFIFLCCLLFQTARAFDDDFWVIQRRAAEWIEKIPDANVKLFLYSLDPNDPRVGLGKLPENSDQVFHHWPILGRVEIVPTQEKEELLGAFAKGVRQARGVNLCIFEPRHGLRVITESGTNDFVICYHCGDVAAYGFNSAQSFQTGSAQSTFDKFLDEYKIKKAK